MSEADAELVQRVLDGERSAFEALVARHIGRCQAVARSILHNDPAVDDVVQEAFMRAYNRLGQLSQPSQFPSWLATITRNEAISWLRRQKNKRSVGMENVVLVAPEADSEEESQRAEDKVKGQLLRITIGRLKDSYREIITLKYDSNLSYEEMAETLGTTVANVEKRLYRARKALHREMLKSSVQIEAQTRVNQD
ncbi:MAG: RNA polymerase sigma factor [Planctomycetes bacterium]|nr:RNA polymerase sigma factor [Planctomycetota bacterium]